VYESAILTPYVVPVEQALEHRLGGGLVDILLARLIVENPVEHETFVFVVFGAGGHEAALQSPFGPVLLVGIECENAVVDNLNDIAET
jgi:hypothetical protein